VEQVFCTVYRFHFSGDALRVDVEPNVEWHGSGAVTLTGRAAVSAA
jgi:hypothetical protein